MINLKNACSVALLSLACSSTLAVDIYGLKNNSGVTGYGSLNTRLFTVDTATNTVTSSLWVTLSGSRVYADGLAMTTSGDLYAFVNSNTSFTPVSGTSQLVSADAATGIVTAIGAQLSNRSIMAAGFDFDDRLWGVDLINKELLEIDQATGAILQSVSLARGYQDIAYTTDNSLYAVRGSAVYSLDRVTGVETLVYQTSGNAYNGITFAADAVAYLTEGNQADELRRSPSAAFPSETTVIGNLTGATGSLNSGQMDLAGMPNTVIAEDDSYTTVSDLILEIDSPATDITVILDNDYQLLQGALEEVVTLDAAGTDTVSAQGGVVSVSGNTISYSPATGYSGIDSFTYQVCIDSGACDTATVTLQIVPPPFAVYDEATTPMNVPVSIAVLDNDIISASMPVTISSYTQGANGTVALSGDSLVYTPANGFTGTDTFTYTICDQNGACSTAVVTVVVTVLAVDTRPVPALLLTGLMMLILSMAGLIRFAGRRHGAG